MANKMKTVIIYESKHHGNTKKLCDGISNECGVTIIEAQSVNDNFEWKNYDIIGFASGIAFKKFYDEVNKVAERMPSGKKCFSFTHVLRTIKTFQQIFKI